MRKQLDAKQINRKTKRLTEQGEPITRRRKRKDPKVLAVTQIKKNGQPKSVSHAAFAFQNAYYNGSLDKRSHLGQLVRDMEREYATHMGFQDFSSCPITLREQVRLLIGNWIFQCFYRASDLTLAHLRASENLTHRITRELGLKPEAKSVQELQAYLKEEGYAEE